MNSYTYLYTDVNLLDVYMKSLNINSSSHVLVQIYINTDVFSELKNINDKIYSLLPKAKIVGVLSNLNITSKKTIKQTTITFTTFKHSTFKVFSYNFDTCDACNLGINIAKKEFSSRSKIAFLYSNMIDIDCENMLNGINSLGNNVLIAGGIISKESNNRMFLNDSIIENGIVGFVIDSNELYVHSFTNYNYMPIGKNNIITDAKKNIIKSIDNMPAKEFYEKYLGTFAIKKIDSIGFLFPLLIKKTNTTIPKTIVSITKEGYILTNTSVNKGDLISLGYGNSQNLIEKNRNTISQMSNIPIECIFVFTGNARNTITKKHVQYKLIDDTVSINGFLTDSEFVTRDNIAYVSICGLSFVTLSEDPNACFENIETIYSSEIQYNDEELALLNLVENTSKELSILNQTLENMVMQKTNELLKHYYTDELTMLPNLNKLKENINNEEITSLALIDVSSFININNFYGTYIGNKLLRELADLITLFTKSHGYTTYKVHSDIFAITALSKGVAKFNENIKSLQSIIHKHCFIAMSVEIYITTIVAICHTKKNLYENTSMTLEYAKGQKIPNLIYEISLKIEESIENNLLWTSRIRNAIDSNNIVPYYQPIYNNHSNSIDKYEVLMRLVEDNEVYSPYYFLDIAKKTNLYKPLTKIMIEKAFNYFKDFDYKFSINLSSEDIIDINMRNYIYEKLELFPKSENVIFEIVESEGIDNYDEVKAFIKKAKSYGVGIAIDDFGTGFSNFHYLFKLNVDYIKIDGSIIQQINDEKAALSVAETIVDFAKKMNISTVAEFVSDKAIFNKANELGINYSQGYFVSKPKEYL